MNSQLEFYFYLLKFTFKTFFKIALPFHQGIYPCPVSTFVQLFRQNQLYQQEKTQNEEWLSQIKQLPNHV